MSQTIDRKRDLILFLLFIPVAYFSYLFHEFGHWTIGELLGNDMAYSLNYVWAKNGSYIESSDDLYISLGGPIFTIFQALIFLLMLRRYRTIYLYPFIFFPMFMRLFSIVLGGFGNQDEARISTILNIGTYTVAIIVLTMLFLIVLRASQILRISLKTNGYFFTISTLCQLLVIETYRLFLG
jgi:hypothetical protein